MTRDLYSVLQLKIVVSKAIQPSALDHWYRVTTEGWAKGLVDDDNAQEIYELIDNRRRAMASNRRNFLRKKAQRSADRPASIARRRRRAAYAPISPRMAANFTTSELSILSVIADEVRKRGALVWAVDRIAATAGVSRSMVQKTYAKAERMGLIEVDRVRPAGMRNLYNKVRIKCSDWLAWIRGRGGKKNSMTTNKQDLSIEGPQAAKPCIDRDSNPYHPHGNVRFPVLHLDNGIPRVLSKGAVRSRL